MSLRGVAILSAFLTALLTLESCGLKPKPNIVDSNEAIIQKYAEAINRLPRFLSDGIWVVSLTPNGNITNEGDGLIFSGLAMAALPCDGIGRQVSEGLAKAITDSGGQLYRHPTLRDKISLDGALGLYRGVLHRVLMCGDGSTWNIPIKLHYDYVKSHDYRMNDASEALLEMEFDFILDALAARMGLREAPSTARSAILIAEVTEWARIVLAAKAGCYRVHLGYQVVRMLDELGFEPNKLQRSLFCGAATGGDLPLSDHYCGMGLLLQFIEQFKYNEWEYRHQRCGTFETPDAQGWETPGLDLILAIKEAYKI